MKADEQLLKDLVEALEPHIEVIDDYESGFPLYVEPNPLFCPLDQTLREVLKALYGWCERWLEDPQHDALRARGDERWHAVCGMQHHLQTLLDVSKGKELAR